MSVVFHAPPGWPPPPIGWLPPAGWSPPKSWPPAPQGWTFYLELVPSYRRHAILVHPARGAVDPAYRMDSGPRSWRLVKSGWKVLHKYSLVTVPIALIVGVVVCILILGLLARGVGVEATRAIQACSVAVQEEGSMRAPTARTQTPSRGVSPAVSVTDVSDPAASLVVVTGVLRGASGSWSFTCRVSTAGESPTVSQLDLQPLLS